MLLLGPYFAILPLSYHTCISENRPSVKKTTFCCACVLFTSKQLSGVLAATFDLAAFLVSMIALVQKSVNHLRTISPLLASMCKTRITRGNPISFSEPLFSCSAGQG